MISLRSKNYNCPVEFAVDLIGGKWKPRIITYLGEGTLRFGELSRLLPDTSRKVLIEQLRELEIDGIVCRDVFAEVPPRVEYSLTADGRALLPIFAQLRAWGSHQVQVLTARSETAEDTRQ